MKVYVDQDLCISCGLCISICEEVFHRNDDDKAEAVSGDVRKNWRIGTEAVESCPTEAIKEI